MLKTLSKIGICLLLSSTLLLTSCFLWKQPAHKDPFINIKGKNIAYVIGEFNRASDVIEDWGGYKRYTWHVCKNTGNSVVSVRNNNAEYYKSQIRCCDAQFDVNWDDKIVNYNGEQLAYCPIDLGFKK